MTAVRRSSPYSRKPERLLIRNARVLTLAGPVRARRGRDLGNLAPVAPGDVLVEGGTILAVGPTPLAVQGRIDSEINADGRVLMPGFVDCHTHACWAGSRLDEWDLKRHGTPYQEILRAGGGIMSTVRAVRLATQTELTNLLRDRLGAMLRGGTTTVEVKSGYGLTTVDEIKMLRAIGAASERFPGTLVATALLGHAVDPEEADFVDRTIRETLPSVSSEFPEIAIDAYCEKSAWSVEDCLRLFDEAIGRGHSARVHADQFSSLGMIPAAIKRRFRSVDHLEASTPEDLAALAASDTFGVILPCCGLHLDDRYADARRFVDEGGALALATNYNPGSAPCHSMPMAIALAVRKCGLEPAEAISAATVNAAALLGLTDRGVIAPDRRADMVLLNTTDEREMAFEFGTNPVDTVICDGVAV